MSTQIRTATAEELLCMPDDGVRRELVHGEIHEMAPAGHEHGGIAYDLGLLIGQHVRGARLGRMYAAETGFRISRDPDTVRAPDVAFVSRERVEAAASTPGFFPGAPDLAAEVVSPSDRYGDVLEKVNQWLDAGARMVLVVDPQSRTVAAHRSPGVVVLLTEQDFIDGADVVPGLRIPVRDIFA